MAYSCQLCELTLYWKMDDIAQNRRLWYQKYDLLDMSTLKALWRAKATDWFWVM